MDQSPHQTIRIIQLGAGRAGRGWANLVHTTPGFELVALVDTVPDALASVGDEVGLPPTAHFPSLAAALEMTDADAIVIVTPPETHAPIAIAALQAGKHVLTEKPLAIDLTEAAAMLHAATKAQRTLMVAQNYRYFPPARAVRNAVASGFLGNLRVVRIAFRRDIRQYIGPGKFHHAMRHPLLFDMSIHHIDLLRAITGRDIATVYARSWPAPDASFLHHPSVTATFTLECGGVATYDGDWAGGGDNTSWSGDWELTGTNGRLLWRGNEADVLTGTLTFHPWDAPTQNLPIPDLPAPERAGVLAAFQDAITTGARPETDASDNIRSLAAVLAAAHSADTGEVVAVAPMVESVLTPIPQLA